MAKGFFRELKHYKVNEISIELGIEMEETKRGDSKKVWNRKGG